MHTLQELRSGKLSGVTRLDLSENLTTFPLEILELADTLEVLNLTNNSLSSLPEEFGKLKKLDILFCANNNFTEVPEVLQHCPNLRMVAFKNNQIKMFVEDALPLSCEWLVLTNNKLTSLPNSIGKLTKLKKVALAGNMITSLPESMQNCRDIELLRISANNLTAFPEWLYRLPKLAWLAYSGNPFCTTPPKAPLPEIGFDALSFETEIGEGASGVITKGRHLDEEVAIKIFKGAMTSDGYPEDEMNAAIHAGTHHHLIDIMGRLHDHQEAKEGLILALIPAHYKSLGHPSSLLTCTRDTFEANKLSLPVVLSILKGIASVSAHLHERALMHGDLYAHNILMDENGHALLGDFGAASYKEGLDQQRLERIEVRAFGYLIEDLLTHKLAVDAPEVLINLMQHCLASDIEKRPLFKTIEKELEQI